MVVVVGGGGGEELAEGQATTAPKGSGSSARLVASSRA